MSYRPTAGTLKILCRRKGPALIWDPACYICIDVFYGILL